MDVSRLTDPLRSLVAGRRVIFKFGTVAGAMPTVRALRSLGAIDVLVVATDGTGLGDLPGETEALWVCIERATRTGDGYMARIRAGNAAIAQLPSSVRAVIETFDPDRRALILGDFLNEHATMAGRPFLSYRRPEWLALDDKTTVAAVWERAGVRQAPSAVVPAQVGAVAAAFARLDRGDGVVVAVDSSEGCSGGATGTRWARTEADIATVLQGWDGRRARVMPFLEGIPCSVHGFVFDTEVAVFRPVEMVTLRTGDAVFFYGGCASFWDPPAADREVMRSIARRVGAVLRSEAGFRGVFTVDGVLTVDGFLPTEINPRNGAGLSVMVRPIADALPLQLLIDAVAAGVPGDWQPERLESELVELFDQQRQGGTWRRFPGPIERTADLTLVYDDGTLRHADPAGTGTPSVVVSVASEETESFVRATFADATPAGPSVAQLAAATWGVVDDVLGLGIGPLAPAQPRC